MPEPCGWTPVAPGADPWAAGAADADPWSTDLGVVMTEDGDFIELEACGLLLFEDAL
jgi:hypothetical protein